MMRSFLRGKWVWVLVLALVLLSGCVDPAGAMDSPIEPPVEGPVLEDPTDLVGVLNFIATGGFGAAIAFFMVGQDWFNDIESDDLKRAIVMGAIVGVPLLATLLLDLVPTDVWAVIQPYWAVAAGAFILGWPVNQAIFMGIIKPARERAAMSQYPETLP